jgi:hypothetical protein
MRVELFSGTSRPIPFLTFIPDKRTPLPTDVAPTCRRSNCTRRGTQRNGRRRAQARRHRRHRDCRRDAGNGRTLSGPHPEMGRRHRGRRLLVHDPCPPRRGGDRLGPLRDGADHAWRERPLRRRAHPQCHSTDQPRRPVRAALWANGTADFVHDPGIALHEDLWALARAIGDGLGRAARMGGQETRAPLSRRRSPSRMSSICG